MFALQSSKDSGTARLSGALTLDTYAAAQQALTAFVTAKGPLVLDGTAVTLLDSSGALLLRQIQEKAGVDRLRLVSFRPDLATLIALVSEAALTPEAPPPRPHPFLRLLERLGAGAARGFSIGQKLLTFLGQITVTLGASLRHPSRFRFNTLSRHIDETGIAALPIVGLVAFLIAVVLAYQGAFQLKPLGAEQFTVNLVGVSVLREMAVLLTAIMVAGRSGSAFTAEIGMMKVNQEIDALAVIGIDPFDSLVIPRLLALVITLPVLTFAADMLGILGGGIICANLLSIPWPQYIDQLQHAVKFSDFLVGMIKAPVFALLIAAVACLHGLEVSGSAESVGKRTTASVVHGIFLVLVADALFSILFVHMGL